jgi:cysteine desulfurase
VGFPNIDATVLLSEMTDVAASAGSACHAGSSTASSVLGSMRVPQKYAMGTIRLSVGKMTTENEIESSIESICKAVERISLSMR